MAILAASVLVSAAFAQEPNDVPKSIENAPKDIKLNSGKEGGLIFSATYSGAVNGTHHLVFGPSVSGKDHPEFSVVSNPSAETPNWRQEGKAAAAEYTGRLVVITLPEGDFELRRHIVVATRGASFFTQRNMRYRFSIRAGNWIYLGNVHADFKRDQVNAMTVRTLVADERFRDLPLLHALYKNILEQQVTIDLREIGEIDSRYGPTLEDLGGLLPKPGAAARQDDQVMRDLHDLRELLPR